MMGLSHRAIAVSNIDKNSAKPIKIKPSLFSRLTKYLLPLASLLFMVPGMVSAQTTLLGSATVSLTLTEGTSFSQNYIGSGTLNNSYTISGSLPPGLSKTTGTPPASTFNTMITFSGTPSTPGTYTFDVNVTPTNFSGSPPPYTTTFSITVLPLPPVANALSASVQANTSANDLIPTITGSATSLTISTAPTRGTATVSGLGLKYTPTTNFVGTDTVSYIAVGAGGSSSPATATITVTARPATTATATVLANSGANPIAATIAGTASSIALSAAPTKGVLTISGLAMSYVPALGFVGTDTFTYTASGAFGVYASSVVTITVTAAAPTVSASTLTTQANSTGNLITPAITGITTSIALSTAPSHGIATVNSLTLVYTPAANYVGTDTLSFTAIGPGGSSVPATVTITVVATPPATSNFTFQANSAANPIAPTISGTASSFALSKSPAHGIVTINGLALTYTPSLNYVGSDTFTYHALGTSGVFASSTVTITLVATPPATSNFTFQTNSAANPIVPTISGTASSFAVSKSPAHGIVTINGLALTYTPNLNYVGGDTFTYDALGTGGVFASSTVTISVVATAPTISITSLAAVSGRLSNIDLATYVSGPIFTGVTFAIATAPSHGTATISGTILTYIPARNFVGVDTLSITASAVGGTSSPATITVTVLGRPDPSQDTGVVAMQSAVTAAVRHFERAQLDNFNGRLTELASNAPSKTKTNKQCGEVAMWAAGLNGLGSYKGPNGFDYNNSGTSIGGDRCFGGGSTVAGFGVGYGREHSKLNADGSVMRATAATGAAYGSLQLIPSLRISWVAGVNQIDNNFDRYISINKSFGHGKWSGKQYLSSGSVSHDFKFDQFFFVPFAKLDLSRLRLDPYAETGGGAYGLRYQAQTMSSRRMTIGFNGEYTVETGFGELTPRVRVEYQRDSAKRNPLQVSYADGTDDFTYVIPADELDRHALLGSMGAELVLKNGAIIILNYAYSGANGGNKASGLQLRLSYKF